MPLSLPSIATLVLSLFVFHWNSWFDGLILMTSPIRYPLQTYMQAILEVVDPLRLKGMTAEQIAELMKVSNRTLSPPRSSLPRHRCWQSIRSFRGTS